MKDPIRKGELKGVGQGASHINFDQLKKQLELGQQKGKSAFSNFFDTLKENKDKN